MDTCDIIEELVSLLSRNQVEIRKASLGGNGSGLCRLKGKDVFFFDTEEEYADVAVKCAGAITAKIDFEAVYLRPEIREFIEKYGRG